ncbi:conserved hypothetical protein [Xylanimonas cellulosilytica DSM 15894]|uniref:Carbohydrate-binding domain-containing protein n=1 Tax=Xylanimonas cellulosilytica (strain DSM 15894 / JCM 12276 / CECT 5975 / KCTC 9989 / LMG 20990 / NBRC 107835 / XIL07) TaxID=446471 RepID=D1C0K7_XYLCX|nr:carbohydrate-binding domain-containing protein [Xylanimonas cellulosilytica]ACZ32210.1 conserved hypothetical protein [Xylanimonas cellulosilytica DSM 15894]
MNRLLHTTRQSRRALAVGAAAALAVALVTGCTADDGAAAAPGTASSDTASSETAAAAPDNEGRSAEEVMADNLSFADTAALIGQTWDESEEVAITLTGSSATVDDGAVTVDGDTVTVTAPGTYRLSGTLAGQVVVDSSADGVVRLVLDGADITSATTSALAVADADQVSVVLADGSDNTLTDAAQYAETDAENAPNAALFSTADLAVSGGGTLTVTGRTNDGIGAKDGLVLDADVRVSAVDDGVRGKDYLVVAGGTLTVEADGDAMKSDNDEDATAGYVLLQDGTVSLTAGVDGIDAATDVVITGGTLTVAAGDDGVHAEHALVIAGGDVTVSRSEEGLEGLDITLTGGTVDVTASDDGVNASDGSGSGDPMGGGFGGPPADGGGGRGGGRGGGQRPADGSERPAMPDGELPEGMPSGAPDGDLPDRAAPGAAEGAPATGASLTITGGTLRVNAEGDGLDSNGTLTMTGGDVVVHGPTDDGNGALDTASGLTVDGGTLVAVGSAGMAETPDDGSAQGWLSARFDSAVAAGTTLTVTDADGVEVARVTVAKSAASLVVSTAGVTTGVQYTVTGDDGTQVTVTAGEGATRGFGR